MAEAGKAIVCFGWSTKTFHCFLLSLKESKDFRVRNIIDNTFNQNTLYKQ